MKANNFRFKESEIGIFNQSASKIIKYIEPNCRIMGLTQGDFSLIDLIHEILKKIGSSDVICTTWSAGIKDAHQVKWMVDSDLINSFKIITDHSYATRQKKYAAALDELFGKENIRTSEIHAKFTLIKNNNWNIVIRTSMNLNANKTCENFEIDDSKQVYDFYMDFINHTFSNMPIGFIESSKTVSECVDLFFKKNFTDKTTPKKAVNHDDWSNAFKF
jgi:hypothetical protein